MGVRRSLGSKAIEHSPAIIAMYNLVSPSRPYFNNHSQRVAVGSVECVSTFSQFLIQREMLSQGLCPEHTGPVRLDDARPDAQIMSAFNRGNNTTAEIRGCHHGSSSIP
jgi:hypothetical protein